MRDLCISCDKVIQHPCPKGERCPFRPHRMPPKGCCTIISRGKIWSVEDGHGIELARVAGAAQAVDAREAAQKVARCLDTLVRRGRNA